MGFFFHQSRDEAARRKAAGPGKHIPIESMNKLGCKACPLDKADLISPKMQPEGADRPLIYLLGEHPGESEDVEGKHFAGKTGRLLRNQFSSEAMRRDVRISNVIRCRPAEGKSPELPEIECCRNHLVRDIEETKPLVIVGAGNISLKWATGITDGVTAWRGRLIATKIGNHPCWFLPILHPAYVMRKQGKYGKSEFEKIFEYDIQQLLDTLPEQPPHIYEAPYDKGITIITGQRGQEDYQALEEHFQRLLKEPEIALDYETNGLRPYGADAKLHLASVGTFKDTLVFPMDDIYEFTDRPANGWSGTYRRKVRAAFGEFLLQSGRKIAHNLSFEMEWSAFNYGEEILRKTEWEDTLALSHTLVETPKTHSLDLLTREHFGFFLKDLSPVDLKHKKITDYPLLTSMRYNGLDVKWTYQLKQDLAARINQQRPEVAAKYWAEYERKIRLAPTLVMSQLKGAPVDFEYVDMMKKKLDGEIHALDGKISRCPEVLTYSKQFGKFEPTNTDHVLKLMRDVCKRDEVKKALGGETTDEEALSKIPENEVPSAPLILEHRAASKLTSTYIDPLVTRKLVGADGCLHTSYSSMIAVTGRLASSDPNMQNFPKRKRREVRGVIAAPEGSWIVASDYGQIEARVFGMASEDKNLVKYLWTGYDIHGFWADRFMKEYPKTKDRIIKEYEVDGDDTKLIRKKFRDEIKNGWVFPQFFGASTYSCAGNLKVPELIAKDLGDEFWDEFKGVKKWQDKLLASYDKNLYVETLGGRRRRGAMTKNEILNHPIQGTAADIVTAAMNAVSERSLIECDPQWQPNLNIHDDLTFIIEDQRLDSMLPMIGEEMCKHRFDYINVPLIVEVQVGKRWHELEEIAVYRSNELFNLEAPSYVR